MKLQKFCGNAYSSTSTICMYYQKACKNEEISYFEKKIVGQSSAGWRKYQIQGFRKSKADQNQPWEEQTEQIANLTKCNAYSNNAVISASDFSTNFARIQPVPVKPFQPYKAKKG